VFSEAYAPEFALRIMERHRPHLIDKLDCRATNWAVYEEAHKLIRVEGIRDELFSLREDPREMHSLEVDATEGQGRQLGMQLDAFLEQAVGRRLPSKVQRKANLDDEVVRQRLRGLGYTE
jgi:hypothetical protein